MEAKRSTRALVLLLFIGLVLMVGTGIAQEEEARACPEICYIDAAYMTCPSTGDQRLEPACSCCIGGPGCSLFRANGDRIC